MNDEEKEMTMEVDKGTDDAISEIEKRIKKIKDKQITYLSSKEDKIVFDSLLSDIQAYCKEIENTIKKLKRDAVYFKKKGTDYAFDRRDPFFRACDVLGTVVNQLEINLNWRNLIWDVIIAERRKLYAIIGAGREKELELAKLMAEKELAKEKREGQTDLGKMMGEKITEAINKQKEEKSDLKEIKDIIQDMKTSTVSQIEDLRRDIDVIKGQKPEPEGEPGVEKPSDEIIQDLPPGFSFDRWKMGLMRKIENRIKGGTNWRPIRTRVLSHLTKKGIKIPKSILEEIEQFGRKKEQEIMPYKRQTESSMEELGKYEESIEG